MTHINLVKEIAQDLLWRLEVIENRLTHRGYVDLVSSFMPNTASALVEAFIWGRTEEGYDFWSRLRTQLESLKRPDIDLVQGARKAVAKYLREAA